jgi:Tat protein translocase TatB subunit
MFEVGFTEIVLILGIALLVLGPARLPKLAADVGRWAGKARAMARQLKTQLEQEAATFDPMRDTPRPSPTIHTPPPAATAAATEATQAATAREPAGPGPADASPSPADALESTDESKSA